MRSLRTILVTGGAGFIGSHLVDGLVNRGYRVRVLDNLDPQIHPTKKLPSYFNKKAEFMKGDVTRKSDWKKALFGVDAVYHFAAAVGVGQSMYEVERYVKVNSFGTALLLDYLANTKHTVKKIIVAASMSSYGEGEYECKKCGRVRPLLRPESQLKIRDWEVHCPNCKAYVKAIPTREDAKQHSNSIYAIGKKNQEEMVLNIGLAYSIPAVALRYFNVYGQRQSLSNPYNGVAAIFISRIKNGKKPVINEDGLQTRDFVHVSDVTRANISALENSRANYKVYNVGTGNPITISEVAQTIVQLLGSNQPLDITNKVRKLDVRHCFADISRISTDIGWNPQISFREGLRDVIDWGKGEVAVDHMEYALHQLEKRGLR
ncbi:SDR family NAD(P)-dependent oxidoreductase [Candidatus Gottesmanbacteria bacterium]|nr:SDR family NAD(P)-dependent oxidoreductase [Candidatus Gottesmanbacteria bacterium]